MAVVVVVVVQVRAFYLTNRAVREDPELLDLVKVARRRTDRKATGR